MGTKKRFATQQLLTQINGLARNILVWAQRWLTQDQPELNQVGFVRLMRDVFTALGELCFDATGRPIEIRLNSADFLIRHWFQGLSALLLSEYVAVNLVKT